MRVRARAGQPPAVLGVEVLAVGALLAAAVVVPAARGLKELERRSWGVRRVGMAVLSVAPMIVGGALLIIGLGGALYWLLAEVVAVLAVSTFNAWVLLIEIRR